MKYIFLLSKENIGLAKEEVLSLVCTSEYQLIDNLLIVNTNKKGLERRLAYTKCIYELLFECKTNELIKNMEHYNWQSVYKGNFSIRVNFVSKKKKITQKSANTESESKEGGPYSEAKLAGYIWKKVKKPKVNLTNAKTNIELFFTKNKIFCGLLLHEIRKDFLERRSHLRPGFAPVSLNPRLARTLVNLSGVQKGETILDPFCGTGGILIESGLMGIKGVGLDIDENMLEKAQKNLGYYKIKNIKLMNKDATEIRRRYNYIVTDLPYGKNTKNTDLIQLYTSFLKNLKKILIKRAVIVFPDFINYRRLIKDFRIEKEFSYYIHKSMTKKIIVLQGNQ